jgi:hypothetical protein
VLVEGGSAGWSGGNGEDGERGKVGRGVMHVVCWYRVGMGCGCVI